MGDCAECEWGEFLMANYIATDTDLEAVADAIRNKGGTSADLEFPHGFVDAIDAIETGGSGSGATVVASGTFTGNGSYSISIPVGSKMPQTDFIFKFWVDDDTEFPYNSSYKFADCAFIVLKGYASYDLSPNGTKAPISQTSVRVNNSGTITTVNMKPVFFVHQSIRNDGIGATQAAQTGNQRITRSSEGFQISVNQGNSMYIFVAGMTFNWQIIYIGDSPTTDIVEVA